MEGVDDKPIIEEQLKISCQYVLDKYEEYVWETFVKNDNKTTGWSGTKLGNEICWKQLNICENDGVKPKITRSTTKMRDDFEKKHGFEPPPSMDTETLNQMTNGGMWSPQLEPDKFKNKAEL